MMNFNFSQQPGESDEQHSHRFAEAVLSEDWRLRAEINAASYKALGHALADEQDPTQVLELTQLRGEYLVRTIGSSAIALWQRDVFGELASFEQQFAPETE